MSDLVGTQIVVFLLCFDILYTCGLLIISALAVESLAVPFNDNTRTQWSVPQTNTQKAPPTSQQQRGNNQLNAPRIVQVGSGRVDLNKLFGSNSVIIPLDNLQILNGDSNNNTPNINNASVSNQIRNNRLPQAAETRQNPVRVIKNFSRINTFPIKFPKSNTAIYIPTNLISRIRRQTPKGFLVLPVMGNNQTVTQKTTKLEIPNINNGSVLFIMRRSPSNGSQPVQNLGQTRNISSNIQGIFQRRPGSIQQQNVRSVNSNRQQANIRPINNQIISNQPISARGTAGIVQSASTIQQQRQPRIQIVRQNRRPTVIQQRQPVQQQLGQTRRQVSGIVSRNRPLVQTVSSNGRFPRTRTQTLRTGQTGQVPRRRTRPVTRRQPVRRPPPPSDPFSRRFSAGFTRGSNLLVQPPFENTTFFNADGTRVTIDSDVNGNVIRRTLEGPGGTPIGGVPQPLGAPMLPPAGMPFGGGVLPGAFPGPGLLGGFGRGFGGFGII